MPETTPAETLRSAAALIRKRVAAMKAEMEGPGLYWQMPYQSLDMKYQAGVNGGLGGAAGEMAAAWDLSTNEAVADLLDESAAYYESLSRAEAAFVAQALGGDMDPGLKIARLYLGEVSDA